MIDAAPPLTIPAQAAAMGSMDAWLASFADGHGIASDMREELRVCLHELAANVIMHGGTGNGPRTISLSGHMDGASAVIDFADDAPAFDPLSRITGPATGGIEDVAIGGLGLHLVRSFTDSLDYRRAGGWNCLRLVRGPRAG